MNNSNDKSLEVIDKCLKCTQLSFKDTMEEIYIRMKSQGLESGRLFKLLENGSKEKNYIQLWKYFKEILAVYACDEIDFVLRQGHNYAFKYKHIDYIKSLFEEYSSPNFKKMRSGNFVGADVNYVINAVDNFHDFIRDYITDDNLPEYRKWLSVLYIKTDYLILVQKRIQNSHISFLEQRIEGLITDKEPYDTYLLTTTEKIEWLNYVHYKLKKVEYELISILQEMDNIKSDELMEDAILETPNISESLSVNQKCLMLDDYLNYKVWQSDELQTLLEKEKKLRIKASVHTPIQLGELFDNQRNLVLKKKQELLQKIISENRITLPTEFDTNTLMQLINSARNSSSSNTTKNNSLLNKAIKNIINHESV